jgi:hypothetical protein
MNKNGNGTPHASRTSTHFDLTSSNGNRDREGSLKRPCTKKELESEVKRFQSLPRPVVLFPNTTLFCNELSSEIVVTKPNNRLELQNESIENSKQVNLF